MHRLRRLHPSCASAGLQDISDIKGYFSPSATDIKLHRWCGKTYPRTCIAFPWPSPPSCGYVYIWLPTFASVAAAATGENLAHVLLKPSSFDFEKTWQVVWKCSPPPPPFFWFNSLFTTFSWNTRPHAQLGCYTCASLANTCGKSSEI